MATYSALHQIHVDSSSQLVLYSGYELPLHYGNVLVEHNAVRDSAGVSDCSYLRLMDIKGQSATSWLRMMLSGDVASLADGRAMYSCLCKENGGVVNDLVIFKINQNHYRLSVDRARYHKTFVWLKRHLNGQEIDISKVTGITILSVQGPDAVHRSGKALLALGRSISLTDMPRYSFFMDGNWCVSRSGCSGEDGLEIMIPESQAVTLWHALLEQDVTPIGLGARETLRIEAGYGLYGQEISEKFSPAESGLAHTIDIEDESRQFIGRDVLEDHKLFGGSAFQVGIALDGPGTIRRTACVELVGETIGTITSGGFSPSRQISVGLARVKRKFEGSCDVHGDGRLQPAHITSVPFVPHGLARE